MAAAGRRGAARVAAGAAAAGGPGAREGLGSGAGAGAGASGGPGRDGRGRRVVVGDIGGTNARLQLWGGGAGDSPGAQRTYPTADFLSFEACLQAFLDEFSPREAPAVAVFAAAGPVSDHAHCAMTNISWELDARSLERGGLVGQCRILNDFEAIGYGVGAVAPEHLVSLHEGTRVERGPVLVLGPGTGFGQALLLWDAGWGRYRVHPSEGSHADFAPRGWKQRALAQHVENELGYCEAEHVCCGSGLVRIYEFLRSGHAGPAGGRDAPPILKDGAGVTSAALSGESPLALEACDIFLSIVGQEAGNGALRALARGGVYVCGGITPRLQERVNTGGLRSAFLHAGSRFAPFLETVPVDLVTDGAVGMLGSREYARIVEDEL